MMAFKKPVRPLAMVLALCGVMALVVLRPVTAVEPLQEKGKISSRCRSELTGRIVTMPPGQSGFGSVQRQPSLPLKRNEYVITIDDGPLHTTTPVLLDRLAQNCIHATFFLIGRRASAAPGLVREIVKQGNGLGSHSQTHPNFSIMTLDAIRQEIETGADSVSHAAFGDKKGSKRVRLMRLPGGTGTPLVPPIEWRDILRNDDLLLAGVDASPEDWRNQPPETSFQRLNKRLPDRGVILLHDGQSNTPALLDMILQEMRRKGAKIVTLSV